MLVRRKKMPWNRIRGKFKSDKGVANIEIGDFVQFLIPKFVFFYFRYQLSKKLWCDYYSCM